MTATPPEILCDENVPGPVVRFLHARGHRLHLPQEFGLNGSPDAAILAFAATNGMVLITENRNDFRRLHSIWMILLEWGLRPAPHHGVLSAMKQEPGTLRWANALDGKLRSGSFLGEMHWWHNTYDTWHIEPLALR